MGSLSQDDLDATLNSVSAWSPCLPSDDVDRAVATLDRFGVRAWAVGDVSVAGPANGGQVGLAGAHPGWGS